MKVAERFMQRMIPHLRPAAASRTKGREEKRTARIGCPTCRAARTSDTMQRFRRGSGGKREKSSPSSYFTVRRFSSLCRGGGQCPANRSKNVRRDEVAAHRAVPRRPGDYGCGRALAAKHVLLRRGGRRRLENVGRRQHVGSIVRKAERVLDRRGGRFRFGSQRDLRRQRRSVYPRQHLVWRWGLQIHGRG